LLSSKTAIDFTHKQLNDVHTRENKIRNTPSSEMNADEKQKLLHDLEVRKQAILKDKDRIGELRKRAGM